MDSDYAFGSHSTSESSQPLQPPRQKRSRILLSCAPCRMSELKSAKSMAARLKRLEGMVRGMMDVGGNLTPQRGQPELGEQKLGNGETPQFKGQVVRGQNATTSYVGGTHYMAMLEDVSRNYMWSRGGRVFLKDYFGDSDNEDGDSPPDATHGPNLLFFSSGAPKNREDLLAQLPEKQYARFWQDPSDVSLHWIAQLFMMLAAGTFFNIFQAPHEIDSDSPVPAADRIKLYRSCAGWALVWGKYMQPNATTLPAFMLYVEPHFIFNRAAQMNCIVSGFCVRLMLKMGLHRDPDKLAGLTPFEGEMRRRMWNLAIQVESIVAFHMGLPSMMQSIESDTAIAKQMHALTPPSYSEVLRLDHLLQETWRSVPSFMMVRPLDECVGDPPMLFMQRFGLAALYNKSRCVLHRRYLAEPVTKPEHDYSRQQCLQAALTLLGTQVIIWDACKPGHSLAHHG
ncbi:hypothetical protein ACO1O0_009047 [Amphichorda felina]